MNEIKTERIEFEYNENYVMCRYCQTRITPHNEPLPRTDERESKISNLEEKVHHLENKIEQLIQDSDRKL